MRKLSEYLDFINTVKSFLQNGNSDLSDAKVFEWDEILKEYKNHSITTLAIDVLNNINIPILVKKDWENEIIIQSSHFIKLLHVVKELSELLSTNLIKWAILKGPSAAIYFSNPMQRTMGDIDVLVAEEDFDKAKQCLEYSGFKFGKNIYKYDRHITAHKNGVSIELHRFFANTRNEKLDKDTNDLLFNALSRCEQKTINGISFNTLPDLENGIVLVEHIWHHIYTGIGLRPIIDFIMYVDKVLDDDFWNSSFEHIATKLKYDKLCKVIARIGQMYFGLDESIKWCKNIDDELANELLEKVLNQGDFGNNPSESFNPTIRVLNKKNEGIISFIRYEQSSGILNWKAAQKHAILRPFAWIYGIGRHIIITISSKENLNNLSSNYIESKKYAGLLEKIRPK